MKKAYVLKLTTGEDILCAISEADLKESVVNAAYPVAVVMQPVQERPGDFRLGLVPWASYSRNRAAVPISRSHIVSIFEPEPDLWNEYVAKFVPKESEPTNTQILKEEK